MRDMVGRIEFGQYDNALYAEIDRLKLEIENLKCCGNCKHYYKPSCGQSEESIWMADTLEYCHKWESDEIKREDRIIKRGELSRTGGRSRETEAKEVWNRRV